MKRPNTQRDAVTKVLAEVNNATALATSIAATAECAKEGTSGRPVDVRVRADAVRGAHKVLAGCRPGTVLPTDLAKLRAMLDSHMFGRDRRELRDDAVRVAWQIDSMSSSARKR